MFDFISDYHCHSISDSRLRLSNQTAMVNNKKKIKTQMINFFKQSISLVRYVPNHANRDDFKKNVNTMEGTAVFLISTYQYVILAFVYSRGPPYRQGIIDNFWFVFSLLVLTALNIWITLAPLPEIRDLLSVGFHHRTKMFHIFNVFL